MQLHNQKKKPAFSSDYGATYTIRVSTTSQTNHSDFTIIDTQSEADFGGVYSAKNIDLSAYNDTPIYVAFVLSNDDGDSRITIIIRQNKRYVYWCIIIG